MGVMAICFGVALICLLFGIWKSTQRVVAPGIHELELPSAGKYLIFHEYQGALAGKAFRTDKHLVWDLDFHLQAADGTEQPVVSRSEANEYYRWGNTNGIAVLEFSVTKPGKFLLTARYPDERKTPEIVLRIKRPLLTQILFPLIVLNVIGILVIALCAGLLWRTFFKRRAAKKQMGLTVAI